jgi:hypothetical protein
MKREGIPTIGCSLSFDFSDYGTTIDYQRQRLSDDYPTIDYWCVSVLLPVVWSRWADVRDLVVFRGSIFVAQCRSLGVSLSARPDV